jgi:hypothetical protein
MNTYYQLPLLPEVGPKASTVVDAELLTSQQKSDEIAYGFSYTWLGWWGALLLGLFDGKILPPGYHVQSITLCMVGPRWGVFINARDNDGKAKKLVYTDLTRQKALRGVRWLMRRTEAEWRDS